MAELLGRSPSTVGREINRNGGYNGYRAALGDDKAWARTRRPKRCKLATVAADDGIAAGEAVECFNPNAAVTKAEALSRKPGTVGAVAFSRTRDPATGDFGEAKVIRKFGEVPDDVSAL